MPKPSVLRATLCIASPFLLAACAQQRITHVAADEVQEKLQDKTPALILDVRSRGEYQRGHVPGAVHVPFYATWSRYSELDVAADEPIIVYCEHGPRAGIAKLGLRMAGHQDVVYLDGHMHDWKARGLPLETGGAPSDDSSNHDDQ